MLDRAEAGPLRCPYMGTSERVKAGRPTRPAWSEERGSEPSRAVPSYWPERLAESVVAEASGRPPSDATYGPLWERWFDQALEQGVEDDLASLGRSVIREAKMLSWGVEREAECGWLDDGEAMLELALVDPDRARASWQALLDDG